MSVEHPLATVLFMMDHNSRALATAASAVLSSGGTALLVGRFYAAECSRSDGVLEGYRWNEDVISSTDYRLEENEVYTVFKRKPAEVKQLKCTSANFLGEILASIRERNPSRGPPSYPYTYPYLPGGATPQGFSLRSWCSAGPPQDNEQPLSACLSVLRGLGCLYFAPGTISPPPRVLAALSALRNGQLPPEKAARVWACLHAYEWQRRAGASSDILAKQAFIEPLKEVVQPMLEMMQAANVTWKSRFVAGLAKISSVMGIAIALEIGKPTPVWCLVGRHSPDQQRVIYIRYDLPPSGGSSPSGEFRPLFPTQDPRAAASKLTSNALSLCERQLLWSCVLPAWNRDAEKYLWVSLEAIFFRDIDLLLSFKDPAVLCACLRILERRHDILSSDATTSPDKRYQTATFKRVAIDGGERQQGTYGLPLLRLLLHPDPQLRIEAQRTLHSSIQQVEPFVLSCIVLSWIQDCITAVPTWADAPQTLESLLTHLRFLAADLCSGDAEARSRLADHVCNAAVPRLKTLSDASLKTSSLSALISLRLYLPFLGDHQRESLVSALTQWTTMSNVIEQLDHTVLVALLSLFAQDEVRCDLHKKGLRPGWHRFLLACVLLSACTAFIAKSIVHRCLGCLSAGQTLPYMLVRQYYEELNSANPSAASTERPEQARLSRTRAALLLLLKGAPRAVFEAVSASHRHLVSRGSFKGRTLDDLKLPLFDSVFPAATACGPREEHQRAECLKQSLQTIDFEDIQHLVSVYSVARPRAEEMLVLKEMVGRLWGSALEDRGRRRVQYESAPPAKGLALIRCLYPAFRPPQLQTLQWVGRQLGREDDYLAAILDGQLLALIQKFQSDGKQYDVEPYAPTFIPLLAKVPAYRRNLLKFFKAGLAYALEHDGHIPFLRVLVEYRSMDPVSNDVCRAIIQSRVGATEEQKASWLAKFDAQPSEPYHVRTEDVELVKAIIYRATAHAKRVSTRAVCAQACAKGMRARTLFFCVGKLWADRMIDVGHDAPGCSYICLPA